MSFTDDLTADLEKVFFADFNNVWLKDGVEVVGYLDINAHRWADVDSSQYIFMTPYKDGIEPGRGDTLEISEASYKYVKSYRDGDLLHIVVKP